MMDSIFSVASHRAREIISGFTRLMWAWRIAQNIGGTEMDSTTIEMIASISVKARRRWCFMTHSKTRAVLGARRWIFRQRRASHTPLVERGHAGPNLHGHAVAARDGHGSVGSQRRF